MPPSLKLTIGARDGLYLFFSEMVFKVMKEENSQLRIVNPTKISFKKDFEIKNVFRQTKVDQDHQHQKHSSTITKGRSSG